VIVAKYASASNGLARFEATSEPTAMTNTKTCAACDYPLDENAIQVRIGGQTVEVCCEDCAKKLNEAYASANATTAG
jgi:hypothetical protein